MRSIFRNIVLLLSFSIISGIATGLSAQKNNQAIKEERKMLEYKMHFFEASKQKMLGNLSLALENYKKAAELNPECGVCYYESANLYYVNGDFVTALIHAREAVKIDPKNVYYNLLLAGMYEKNGMASSSVDVYKSLLKLYPDRLDIYLDYCMLLSAIGKYSDALKEFNKLEKKEGVSEMVILEKEKIYMAQGKPEKALGEIMKLVEANPKEPRYYGMLAESYTNLQQYDKATEAYEKLLEIEPDNGHIHLSLAEFYRVQNNPEKSFEELKLAFGSTMIESETKIKLLLAMFSGTTDADTKEKIYQLISNMLLAHPDDPKAHTIYADYLIRDKRYKEARDQLLIVSQTEKNNYTIWEQLILLNIEIRDYSELTNASSEALEYFPNQPVIYLYNGIGNLYSGGNEKAIEVLNKGLGITRNDDDLRLQFLSNLAEAYHRTKKYQKSDSLFSEAIKIDPDNIPVLNNFSYYLALRSENLDKALSMSEKCIKAEQNNSTFLDTYAWVLYKMGNIENALIYIKKAIANGGNKSAAIVEHYGDILYKSGKESEALLKWKEAAEIGKGSDFLNQKIEKGKLVE